MKLDPQLTKAVSLWAEAQYAYSVKQWDAASRLYSRAFLIYEERQDWPAAYKTIYQLYLVAEHQKNWSEMLGYANALMKYDQTASLGPVQKTWLLLGRAERLCQHIAQARHTLAEVVRLSEARMTVLLHDRETVPFDRWYPNEAHIYAQALYEWGLLEADVGKVKEAIRLMAFGDLILAQAIESFMVSPVDSAVYLENKLLEVILLRNLMASDRECLEE